MIKITYGNNKRSAEFILDKIKLVRFDSNGSYWLFKQSVNKEIKKIQYSEFSEEESRKTFIKIDGENVAKDTEILFINDEFDIDEDTKLGSKSLLLRYLTSKVLSKEYLDDINQADMCLSLLCQNLSEENLIIKAKRIDGKFISKIFESTIVKEELYANSIDLTYEETIAYQAKLILNSIDEAKRTIIVIEIKVLTDGIHKLFENLPNNVYVIIVFNESEIELKNDNVYINGVDFQNDEKLYERMEEKRTIII